MSVPRIKASASKASRLVQASVKKVTYALSYDQRVSQSLPGSFRYEVPRKQSIFSDDSA